jgi:hypothetical protein
MQPVALGFRVKSGYAIAVGLTGSKGAPLPLFRRVVDLSDPKVPATRQPYHAGMGTAQQDEREIARLRVMVAHAAKQSVSELLPVSESAPRSCGGATLVVGSVIDPALVANPHIRAHASEGRLFRTVLEEALAERHIPCHVVLEKSLAQEAGKALGRSDRQIRRQLADFKQVLGSPWRGDEKAAALAAWITLASERRTRA